jgi:hypothetical protein
MRTSPKTIFETNFLRSNVEIFKSFQMMYYMTLFGICVNEKKDLPNTFSSKIIFYNYILILILFGKWIHKNF